MTPPLKLGRKYREELTSMLDATSDQLEDASPEMFFHEMTCTAELFITNNIYHLKQLARFDGLTLVYWYLRRKDVQ
jgi:hypothetical protein